MPVERASKSLTAFRERVVDWELKASSIIRSAVWGGGLAGLGGALLLLWPVSYSGTFRLTPTGGASRTQSIASQLGFETTADAIESPFFYVELIRSRTVLEAVARTEFTCASCTPPRRSLYAALGVRRSGRDSVYIQQAVVALSKALTVIADRRSGVVTVSLSMRERELVRPVLDSVLAQLTAFNKYRRHFRARAEREFLSARSDALRVELRAAEDRLAEFVGSNRGFQLSPQLVVTYDRLQREVARLQTVYSAVLQSLEQAKADEIRETPMFTVVEQPRYPLARDPRYLAARVLLLFALGIAIANRRRLLQFVRT